MIKSTLQYSSIRPFYVAIISSIIPTILWSLVLGLVGAIFFTAFQLPGLGFLIGMIGFIVFRVFNLFLVRLPEIKKVAVGIEGESIIIKTGLYSTQSVTLPIVKIDTISFNQSFLMKLCKVGNLAIVSRETTNITPMIDIAIGEAIVKKFNELQSVLQKAK